MLGGRRASSAFLSLWCRKLLAEGVSIGRVQGSCVDLAPAWGLDRGAGSNPILSGAIGRESPMDVFRNMQIFVEVAREKSFRGAAENLGITNSTVSRRIADLEDEVGLRLFDRSTRRVVLTDAGRSYFADCERIMEDARLAREQLANLRALPAGKLRVVSNSVPASHWIIPVLPAFSLRYPDIEVDLDIISDAPSPLEEDVDVALVMGPVTQEDLVARSVLKLEHLGLYASARYVQERGEPLTPAELSGHEGLTHLHIPDWHLVHTPSGNRETVAPRGKVRVASFQALQELSLQHMGISVWHNWLARGPVKRGELQRVLAEWTLQPWGVYAVTTSRHIPAKVRAFVDFIIEQQPQ